MHTFRLFLLHCTAIAESTFLPLLQHRVAGGLENGT
jgi:hypothetical protein